MKKRLPEPRYKSKFILEELEPRQLFSGGAEGVIPPEPVAAEATAVDVDANLEVSATQAPVTPDAQAKIDSNVSVGSYAEQTGHAATFDTESAAQDLLTSAPTQEETFQLETGPTNSGSNTSSVTEAESTKNNQENPVSNTGEINIGSLSNSTLTSDNTPASLELENISLTENIQPGDLLFQPVTQESISPSLETMGVFVTENNTNIEQAQTTNELVIVDTNVKNYQQFIDDISQDKNGARDIEVVLLDSSKDGIAQITETLSRYQNLDAVHLISHGSDGSLDFGSSQLNFQTLIENQANISAWGNAFSANGDLLIYGCNVAETQFGQSFVDYLSGLTGTDVAASENVTGQGVLGGNWALEYQTGAIEAQGALSATLQDQWADVLAVTSNGTVTSTHSTNTTSLTWAHTVNSGSNRALFVQIAIDGVGAGVNSVKYGTTDLIRVGRTAGNHAVEIWVLVNPTVGTNNVVVTFNGNTAASAGASTFNGVNQSTPTGTYASASSQSSGPSTTASVNVSSAVGDLVIDAQYWQGAPTGGVAGGGQSIQWWQQNASLTGGSTIEAGAATVTMSGSFSSAVQWEIGAVSIKADTSSLVTATLQQGVNSYAGTTDTYINSGATSANNGAATTITANASGSQQGLVSFDLSSIPAGSTITSASLNLVSSLNLGLFPSVNLYKMNTSWTSAANWNSFGGGGIIHNGTDAASSSDASFSSLLALGGTATFNTAALASTVQSWVNSPASNYGWLIQGGGLADTTFYSSDTATASNRPQLIVTYTSPTPPSLDLDVNNSSGATGSNYANSFTEGGASVKVADSDASVTAGSNTISSNLSGMTVTISNLLDGSSESLAATTTGTSITASYSSGTGVLTLSGADTAANYQTVLRTITYNNSSTAPSTTSRVINIVATDPYGGNSTTATSTIAINAVNSLPTNTVPGAQTTNEDTAKVFSSANGNQISITDTDAGGGSNEITLTVTNGTLTLAGTTGLTFTSGDGTADATMTFRGTASAINTALNGLSYIPTANYNGGATLTLRTLDSTLVSLNIDANLQARYTFENNANDAAAGTAQDGTFVGNATVSTNATRGQVLILNGSGDSVQINSTFGQSQNVTIGGWVNLSSGTGRKEFISIDDRVHIALDDVGGVKGSVQVGAGVWTDLNSNQFIAGTGWHHVMYVFNGASDVHTLYIDGVQVASAANTNTIYYTGATTTYIGQHPTTTAWNLNGLVDDVRIYDKALSGSEVAALAADLSLIDIDTVAITVAAINDAPSDLYSINGLAESSLVGVYGFNNASNLGRDDAGNNAPITFYGTPGQTTGPSGSGALDLAGGSSGQYGDITGITTGGAMTFAGSVRFDSTGDWQRVFDFGQANSSGIGNVYVGRDWTTNNLTFTIEKNGVYSHRATAINAITNGTWLHFAATVDASGNMNLYVNGNLAASTTGVALESGVRTNNFIGKSHWAGDAAFDGAIDNFVVANGVMSAANVAALYQQSTGFSVAENAANGTVVGTVVGFDVDASANPTYSLTDSAGGRFSINSSNGTITVANGSLLDYESATSHSITVQVTDSAGAIYAELFTVNLSNVAEAPSATNLNASETYTEDTALNLTDIVVSDVDSTTVIATLTLSNPAAGSLSTATSGLVTSTYNAGTGVWNASGAVANVNTLLAGLIFTPSSNFNSNFTIATSISDGTATITGTKVFTGTAVNDVPVNTLPSGLTVNEDGTLSLSGIVITDPDAGSSILSTTLTVAQGTLAAMSGGSVTVVGSGTASITLTGTLSNLNAYLAGPSQPTYTGGVNANGTVQLSIVTSDGLNTGTGGKVAAGTLDYRFQDGANGSEPNNLSSSGGLTGVATDFGVTALATSLSGSSTTFGVIYTGIVEVTTAGTYTFTVGADDSARLFIDGAQVVFAWFTGGTSGAVSLGAGQHSLELRYAQDSGGGGLSASYSGPDTGAITTPLFSAPAVGRLVSQAATTNITVTAVNDAPTATNLSGVENYTEDTALNLTDIVISDVDSATVTATLTLSNTSAGSLNTATSGAVTSTYNAGTGVWTASGAVADVNTLLAGLTFTPSANFNSSFTIATSINDGTTTLTGTKTMTGNAVNDAPVNTLPSNTYTAFNTNKTFSSANGNAIQISDADAASSTVQITLSVSNATLNLASTTGLTLTSGANSSATMTFTGTVSAINTALNIGLTFTPTAGFRGLAQITLVTSDLGNSGSGGTLTDTDSLDIHVGAIVVTNTSDTSNGDVTSITNLIANNGGDGISLREAITAANNTAGTDYIYFNISGTSVHSINLTSPLSITSAVVIDATSDDSFSANGSRPAIVLNGGSAVMNGIELNSGSGGSTIRGFVIQNFTQSGISISNSNGNTIAGNWIGLNSAGTAAAGNTAGINLWNSANNIIGGSSPADRNVISGNTGIGIGLGTDNGTTTGNQVKGNYIGTNVDGSAAIGNANQGIWVNASGNTIGGSVMGEGNVISGTTNWVGIQLETTASNTVITGNIIGLNAAGTTALANAGGGIYIQTSNNTIGGTTAATRNIISGNGGDGITIIGAVSNNTVIGNYIGTNSAGNAVIGNGSEGISLDGATNTKIGGTLTGEGNIVAGNTYEGIWLINAPRVRWCKATGSVPTKRATLNLGNGAGGIRIATRLVSRQTIT